MTKEHQGATNRRLYALQEPKAGRQGEHRC
jgi:hypothetical protein